MNTRKTSHFLRAIAVLFLGVAAAVWKLVRGSFRDLQESGSLEALDKANKKLKKQRKEEAWDRYRASGDNVQLGTGCHDPDFELY